MDRGDSDALRDQSGPKQPQQRREFLALMGDLPRLVARMLSDGRLLLETEGRLALRSLIMLLALALSLAVLLTAGWLLLMIVAVYSALQAGVSAALVGAAVVLLHLLLVMAMVQQMRALTRCLSFPESRRSFGKVLSRQSTVAGE